MKRVVWVYRSYQNAPLRYQDKVLDNCELFASEELKVFSGAIASWQAYAPDYCRALYVDKEVYTFLKPTGLLTRFHEVHVVDFVREIDVKYPEISFFAAPKLWVVGQQKEPFILCDTELVLYSKPEDFIYENAYMFVRYMRDNRISMDNWTEEDIKGFMDLRNHLPKEYVKYLKPQTMVNAGISVWPEPEKFEEISSILLRVCEEVCKVPVQFPVKWTFCEESILVSTVRSVSTKPVSFLPIPFTDKTGRTPGPFVEWSGPAQHPDTYPNYKSSMNEYWHTRSMLVKIRAFDDYAEY